jgi:antitoxin VapB
MEMVENAESFMALNIKNSATVALAEELARRQGVSKTAAIHQALSERLRRLGHSDQVEEEKLADLRAIRNRIARMPAHDSRDDEEIIGFDAHGLPN